MCKEDNSRKWVCAPGRYADWWHYIDQISSFRTWLGRITWLCTGGKSLVVNSWSTMIRPPQPTTIAMMNCTWRMYEKFLPHSPVRRLRNLPLSVWPTYKYKYCLRAVESLKCSSNIWNLMATASFLRHELFICGNMLWVSIGIVNTQY